MAREEIIVDAKLVKDNDRWELHISVDPTNRPLMQSLIDETGVWRDHPRILILSQMAASYGPTGVEILFHITEGPDITATPDNLKQLKFWDPEKQSVPLA